MIDIPEFVKSHGISGARKACNDSVCKAKRNVCQNLSNGRKLAYFRSRIRFWEQVQRAVEAYIKEQLDLRRHL